MSTSREELIALADYLEGGRVFLSNPVMIHNYTRWIELVRLAATPKAGVDREALLKQIAAVCDDNSGPSCHHKMALKFVGDLAHAGMRALPSVLGGVDQPFYGAQCPNYPNCTGGCGLGCTHEVELRTSPCDGKTAAGMQQQCNEQSGKQLSPALEIIEQNCWDLRCVDIPTGAGDADIGWQIIEHHMAPPKERVVGYGNSPIEALNDALAGGQS